jgi:hypothetical protein
LAAEEGMRDGGSGEWRSNRGMASVSAMIVLVTVIGLMDGPVVGVVVDAAIAKL